MVPPFPIITEITHFNPHTTGVALPDVLLSRPIVSSHIASTKCFKVCVAVRSEHGYSSKYLFARSVDILTTRDGS